MGTWEAELLKDLICWFLASAIVVRTWHPFLDGLKNIVKISLGVVTRAPALEMRGAPLSRGPTFLARRSNL